MLASLESRSHVTDGTLTSPYLAHVSYPIPSLFRRRAISKREVSATGMLTLQQEPDDTAVIGKIMEVLEQRIGSDRFGLWFGNRVEFRYDSANLSVIVDGDFALQRLRGNYLRAIESAAAEVLNRSVTVRLMLQADDVAMLALADEAAMAADGQESVDQTDFAGQNRSDQPIKTVSVDSFPVPREVVSPGRNGVSPSDTLGSKSAAPTRRGGAGQRPQRSESRGPAPVGQWLIAAATDPRYSRRQSSSSSNTHVHPSMPSASNPNDAKIAPSAAAGSRAIANRAALKSVRVISENDSPTSLASANGTRSAGPTQRRYDASQLSINQGAAKPDSNGAAEDSRSQPNPTQSNSSRSGDTMTFGNFVTSTSNTLAVTAAKLLAANPAGSTPLCFWGATGTGKTHLLSAIRHELRARHRMPRVLLLSAEDFTNDFLSCVRGTGLPAFRKRYRDVDALLVDNVQFLGGKNATLREMLYTVDTILSRRRPLILAADRQPLEIEGLSADLAGRMSSGLVCGINPMELDLRRDLFRRYAQQSYMPWDDETIELLAQRAGGDGRVIQGISQLVSMLQRMYRRMPTAQEIISQAGDLLQRGPKVVALADVEKAICTAFGLSTGELRSDSKSRNVSQPRILAMYLSRQHTTAAFSEIGRYYGDRNHSTVIAAHRRVEDWIKSDQTVGGRGPKNMKVQEAIAAVENLLRIG